MYDQQVKKRNTTNSPEKYTTSGDKRSSTRTGRQTDNFKPGSLTPADVLQLQRTIGNQATIQLLRDSGAMPIQAKLKIGKPGDKYEQEADQVASEVVNYINAPESQPARREEPSGTPQAGTGTVQRQEEEEEELQMMPEAGLVQRQEEEEEELQMMPEAGAVQRQEEEEEELQMMPEAGAVQRQEEEEEEL